MKDYIGQICAYYLNRRSKKQQEKKQKINDDKLKEVYTRLKQLESFVKFLNEKAFANRHDRKAFWRDVEDGKPVMEDTLKRLLERYGVKKETIEELEKRKQETIQRKKEIEEKRQQIIAEQKIVKELKYIENNVCKNNGEYECPLKYACGGCPYNQNKTGIKKQIVDIDKNKENEK
jgi:hypothetical protein